MQNIIFKDVNLITPFEERIHINVVVKGGQIHYISDDFADIDHKIDLKTCEIYELKDKYLVPGFIDIHTHGGCGVDTYSNSILPWIEYNTRNGITAFVPTLMTMPLEEMLASVENLVTEIKRKRVLSKPIGINMEGPFINPHYGCQKAEYCKIPLDTNYRKFIELSAGLLKIMTVAPELDGSEDLIKELIENKVIVSIGHTDASMDETIRSIDLGANLITHTFDTFGFSGGLFKNVAKGKVCGVREVRALEVLLEREDVYAEVIADRDGIHVNPILLNILLKCKGIDRIIVITDSMSSAGMQDGKYKMSDGREYTINYEKNDIIWLIEKSMIGGVLYKLKDGAKNFAKHTGISFKDAIKTITINPARLLGIDDRVGSIKVGKLADLNVIDRDFNVYMTMINGEIAYRREL